MKRKQEEGLTNKKCLDCGCELQYIPQNIKKFWRKYFGLIRYDEITRDEQKVLILQNSEIPEKIKHNAIELLRIEEGMRVGKPPPPTDNKYIL